MNFIDYCIATKNYSTLKAIKDYTEVKSFSNKATKSFGDTKSKLKKAAKIAGIGAGAAALGGAGALEGKYLYDTANEGYAGKLERLGKMHLTEDPGLKNKVYDTMDRWHGRINSESTAEDYINAAKDKAHEAYENGKHKGIEWIANKLRGSKDEEPEPEPKSKGEEIDDAVRQYMVKNGITNHIDDDND